MPQRVVYCNVYIQDAPTLVMAVGVRMVLLGQEVLDHYVFLFCCTHKSKI